MLHRAILIVLLYLVNLVTTEVEALSPLNVWGLPAKSNSRTVEQAVKECLQTKGEYIHIRVYFEHFKSSWECNYFRHINSFLHNNNTSWMFTIDVQNEHPHRFYRHNLWYVDSVAALRRLLPNQTVNYTGLDRYYIVTLEMDHSLCYLKIRKLLRTMYKINIINVVIIVRKTDEDALIYTYNAFEKNRCGEVEPILVNRFENGAFKHGALLSNKLTNFNNCSLRFHVRHGAPYFMFNKTKNGSDIISAGIEAELLKTLSRKLNFHIEWHSGIFDMNITRKKILTVLKNGEVDVVMGFYSYSSGIIEEYAYTISYVNSQLVMVVKTFHDNNYHWLPDPFQPITWLCILTIIALGLMLVKLAHCKYVGEFRNRSKRNKECKTNKCSGLHVIATVLGTAATFSINRDRLRFYVMMWCFGFMVINAAYQSKLYQSYNNPQTHSPPVFADIYKYNYKIIWPNNVDTSFLENDLNISPSNIIRIDRPPSQEFFEELPKYPWNTASVTIYSLFMYQTQSKMLYGEFIMLPQVISLHQICAYFQSNSYLVGPFDDVIWKLRSFGLIQKWQNDVELGLNNSAHLKMQFRHGEYPEPLNLKQFTPVCLMLVVGLLIASFVFLLEILLYCSKQERFTLFELRRRK